MHPPDPAEASQRPSAGTPAGEPRHVLGRLGESLAGEHLERLGFRILERNVRSRGGEIDLIAFDGHTLVFVEVKTRRAHARAPQDAATPLWGLHPRQRARVRRQAVAWLCEPSRQRPSARALRIDAVGVTIDGAGRLLRIDHVEAAW